MELLVIQDKFEHTLVKLEYLALKILQVPRMTLHN